MQLVSVVKLVSVKICPSALFRGGRYISSNAFGFGSIVYIFGGEEFFIISLSEGSERPPDSPASAFSACLTLSRCRYRDTLPTDSLLTDSSPTRQFADGKFRRYNSSPTGQVVDRKFRRQGQFADRKVRR